MNNTNKYYLEKERITSNVTTNITNDKTQQTIKLLSDRLKNNIRDFFFTCNNNAKLFFNRICCRYLCIKFQYILNVKC